MNAKFTENPANAKASKTIVGVVDNINHREPSMFLAGYARGNSLFSFTSDRAKAKAFSSEQDAQYFLNTRTTNLNWVKMIKIGGSK